MMCGMYDAEEYTSTICGCTYGRDMLVTVIVGALPRMKTYRLSRSVLVGSSRYFEEAFKGGIDTLRIEDYDPHSFELIVQWISQQMLVLPNSRPVPSKAADLLLYVEFVALANHLQVGHHLQMGHHLQGYLETSLEAMRKLLDSDKTCLQSLHIQLADRLPRGNPVLRLFASYCVEEYLSSKLCLNNSVNSFKYQQELENVNGFAFELLSQLPIKQLSKHIVGQHYSLSESRP